MKELKKQKREDVAMIQNISAGQITANFTGKQDALKHVISQEIKTKMEKIKFNEWAEIDLRVGKILKAEDIEGADKLYKLSIDLGKEIGKRTLVAGIKPYYKPAELKNKFCIVFVNLEPRALKGITSEGMLLAAVNEKENKVHIIQPDSDMEPGSKIR